jgi:hypothetical protein
LWKLKMEFHFGFSETSSLCPGMICRT